MAVTNRVSAAEYYCEYKIERVYGDDGTVATPRIYFERDYSLKGLPYTMFTVPQEWVGLEKKCDVSVLPYDTVKLVYDIRGVDCTPLTVAGSEELRRAEIERSIGFEAFCTNNCRILIENGHSQDHSGIGILEMWKGKELVARFYYAVNFTFRKKIAYRLTERGGKLVLEFRCKDRPVGVPVAVCYGRGRLPCLRNDMGNRIAEFTLDFSQGALFRHTVERDGDAADGDNFFSVTIPDETSAKFYILDCVQNYKITQSVRRAADYLPESYTCPFCHRAIDVRIAGKRRYKRGGIACDGMDEKGEPEIFTKSGTKVKRCLYCANDLKEDSRSTFKNERTRLLPTAFMEHSNFKIAFTGMMRAGKTTYISRFFGVTSLGGSEERVSMNMPMIENSMEQFGVIVRPAFTAEVDRTGGSYRLTDADWCSRQPEYTARAISLDPPRYPNRTTTGGNLGTFPFIAEVNGSSYVSFYDVAGEDAQATAQIANLAAKGGKSGKNDEVIGVFCIINIKKGSEENKSVARMLIDAHLDRKCPVAVIVTKFDTVESEFDDNCRLLRSDYFEGATGRYAGSAIEWDINCASEEIRSYLMQKGLLPDFANAFDSVKYFGVSSFNFFESIHAPSEDIETPGRVRFGCSAKRIELPFLWMIHKFGLIR